MRFTPVVLAGKSADHTLYHAHPKGFWKKFRDAVVVNPEISSGLPIPDLHRYPQPGSRPEIYATPATSASDIAFNSYSERDTRRNFPATSYVTQEKLAGLLLASPAGQAALPAPTGTDISTPTTPSLIQALTSLPSSFSSPSGGISLTTTSSTGTGLPPVAPALNNGKRWSAVESDPSEVPRAPDAYWPMVMYK